MLTERTQTSTTDTQTAHRQTGLFVGLSRKTEQESKYIEQIEFIW